MRRVSFFLLAAAAAWAAPHEHRGTYFSVGSGIAYSHFETAESYYGSRHIDGLYEHGYVDGTITFGGVSPAFNFRLGRSVGNAVAIYGDIDFVMISGSFESSSKFSYNGVSQIQQTISQSHSWDEVIGGFFSGGLGIEVYPCRNPNSVMRGFHFGNAFSAGYNLAEVRDHSDWDDKVETEVGTFAILLRTDLGMDWWVSETWSIGVEFAYTTPLYEGAKLTDLNSFRLLFRITRG